MKKFNNSIDLSESRKFVVKLALQTGEILKRHFTSKKYSVTQKSGVDFTTQADTEADEFLRKNILKKYPCSNFLTEETAPKDYSTFKNAINLWVIDPLDGTINFSRGNTNFAISIALVDKGIPKLGVIYKPITEEIYWAQKNVNSAFLNDKPIYVSSTKNLREAVIACDWAWALKKRLNVVKWLHNISPYVRQIKSMGSAASDLASLANGRIDVYIHSGLKPWDTAAASFLIQKSCGKITTPFGTKWNIFQTDILASNKILHNKIINLINKFTYPSP